MTWTPSDHATFWDALEGRAPPALSPALAATAAWWEDVREGAKDLDNCPDSALREQATYLVGLILRAPAGDDPVAPLLALAAGCFCRCGKPRGEGACSGHCDNDE